MDLSSKRAGKVAAYLEKLIDAGKNIIVTEPSVLALFRRDYQKQINNDGLFEKLRAHSYDPVEYLIKLFDENKLNPNVYFDMTKAKTDKLFYHEHCQMKTISAGYCAADFFKNLGFEVALSNVECCGMAGSFVYKKEYYNLSKRVGDDLIAQIDASGSQDNRRVVLASGTSCREQIRDETNLDIYHPVEFLSRILK